MQELFQVVSQMGLLMLVVLLGGKAFFDTADIIRAKLHPDKTKEELDKWLDDE